VYSEAVIPSGLDNIIAVWESSTEHGEPWNGLLVFVSIAKPVQADISPFESFPDIGKL